MGCDSTTSADFASATSTVETQNTRAAKKQLIYFSMWIGLGSGSYGNPHLLIHPS